MSTLQVATAHRLNANRLALDPGAGGSPLGAHVDQSPTAHETISAGGVLTDVGELGYLFGHGLAHVSGDQVATPLETAPEANPSGGTLSPFFGQTASPGGYVAPPASTVIPGQPNSYEEIPFDFAHQGQDVKRLPWTNQPNWRDVPGEFFRQRQSVGGSPTPQPIVTNPRLPYRRVTGQWTIVDTLRGEGQRLAGALSTLTARFGKG